MQDASARVREHAQVVTGVLGGILKKKLVPFLKELAG